MSIVFITMIIGTFLKRFVRIDFVVAGRNLMKTVCYRLIIRIFHSRMTTITICSTFNPEIKLPGLIGIRIISTTTILSSVGLRLGMTDTTCTNLSGRYVRSTGMIRLIVF